MIRRVLHVGHFDNTRRHLTVYGSVIVISLHDRYRRQSRDRVQIGLLLEENIHGFCFCSLSLPLHWKNSSENFHSRGCFCLARAIRIVPPTNRSDRLESRTTNVQRCLKCFKFFLNYPRELPCKDSENIHKRPII